MSSKKSRFSRKTQKGLSTIWESSSEWAADFKTSNKIFIAYKNFKKKIKSFNSNIFLYNKYFKILDEISLSCSEMKLFSFMQDKIIFKVDENYKWEMEFFKDW